MEKIALRSNKVRLKIKGLFELDSTDQFYMDVKSEFHPWHAAAKVYWQKLYEKYNTFLDKDFIVTLSYDFFSRLWELTQIDFLAQHQNHGLNLINMFGKISRPDFCFELHTKKFYLEAVSASPGNSSELNVTLADVSGIARRTPILEYMERLCSEIREKAHIRYYGENKHGYKHYMEKDGGLIISVSLAKIPFHNQACNFYVDLSCIFGLSPMQIPVIPNQKNGYTMGSPYHNHQSTFKKTTSKKEDKPHIKIDYFANDEYSHISAILLSHTGLTFFPDIEHYVDFCHWGNCRNDYTLVHNPFAKVQVPRGFFNVAREVTATLTEQGMHIDIKENYKNDEGT